MADHLPPVHNAPKLRVPFLCSHIEYGDEPRGFKGFSEFPALHGFSIDDIMLSSDDEDRTLALLQSWLFFGLLVEACGGWPMKLDSTEFVQRDRKHITTKMLPKYFWYWQAWRNHLKDHDQRAEMEAHARELDKCLSLANSVFSRVTEQSHVFEAANNMVWSDRNAILLSIALVAEWIYEARRIATNLVESFTKSPDIVQWRFSGIRKALNRAGWCDGEVSRLTIDYNTTYLYYLSLIDRKSTGKNHSKCSSEEGCKALRMDYSKYKPLHINKNFQNCECKAVGPRIREVAGVLDRGHIPLVYSPAPGECALLEYDMQHPCKYVAISHVWSDGLGNPKENRLHTCTFQHIQRLVNKLYNESESPVPFWMDTICIPPQENHAPQQKELRKQGIARMAETYAQADKVLVLDNSLQRQKSDIAFTEILVRIRQAPWTTRIRTLQEGRLGRNLFFQCSDRAISADDMLEITVQKNVATALGLLNDLSDEQIVANECASNILCAFATLVELNPIVRTYAELPPQDDPDEESQRLIAQSIKKEFEEMEDLRRRWCPLIERLDIYQSLTETDERLAADIRNSHVDFVCDYGVQKINHIRGFGYAALVHDGVALIHDASKPWSAGLLTDVYAGIRGRTTSRLEDETVCLGILLQVRDLKMILDIEPLHWRWGQALRGIGKANVALTCHERRMKALLSQIEANFSEEDISTDSSVPNTRRVKSTNALPQSIIFWNVPRLGPLGWNWAPKSFLNTNMPFDTLKSERHSRRTKNGLEVSWPAFVIQGVSGFSYSPDLANDAVLVIHEQISAPLENFGFRQAWQRIRLRQDDRTRTQSTQNRAPPPLISWACGKSQLINNMVILTEHTRIENVGAVLVHQYGMHNHVNLTKHVALLERVAYDKPLSEKVCEVHVWAKWVPDVVWRVG